LIGYFFSIVLIFAIACVVLNAVPTDPTEVAIENFGKNLLQTQNTVGFVVGVIKNGKEYKSYFGSVRKGYAEAPDGKTIFQLASLTKIFTADLLAKAVNHSLVRLDDPASQYLPGLSMPRSSVPITLLDLATHSSGLPRAPKARGTSTTLQEMNEQMGTTKLRFQPGNGYLYSNYAFGILSEALANAYGARNWQAAVENEVIRPIGMTDTVVNLNADQRSRLAQGYDRSGSETNWVNPAFPAVNGSGALHSDLDDMMKYLKYMINAGNPRNPDVDLMTQPYKPMPTAGNDMGLAWQVNTFKDGRRFVSKDGALRGFVSFICFVKGGDVGLVFLANSRFPCANPCKKLLAKLENLPNLPEGEGDGGDGG
jgi:CubicO group peptidase (beta-lactamase class C family)